MIGVPGSGKSTEAKRIMRTHSVIRERVEIVSADTYFMNENGDYAFNPKGLGEAHAECFRDACDYATRGVDCIIVDNTNLTNVERAPYYQLGVAFGYKVHMVWVHPGLTCEELGARNVHGVSAEKIRTMFQRFEGVLPPHWKVQQHNVNGV